jgi:hypothetical protein
MGKIGGFLVGAAILVGVILYSKSADSSEIRAEGEQIVQLIDGYDRYEDYYAELFEKSHEFAFNEAYMMRGRRSSAEFDPNAYKDALYFEEVEG